MADKLQITYHQDAGHGWIEVPRSLLLEHGVECLITSYSYQSGDRVFLEEDQDAATLLKKLEAAGVEYDVKEYYCGNWAFVRNFPRYTH